MAGETGRVYKGRNIMYEQTDDNRQGMYEGVIACYLDERIDSEEFWEVIDNRIYADHETVLDFIEWVTDVPGGHNSLAWLSEDEANELIVSCPTLKEHLIRKGFDVSKEVEVYTDSRGNRVSVNFHPDCNTRI